MREPLTGPGEGRKSALGLQVPANLVRAEIVHYDFAAEAPVRCRFAKRTT